MPATLREVLKTNTFEQQRQIINTLAQDFFDYTLGEGVSSFLSLVDGDVNNPALFFDSEQNLGLYRSGTGSIKLSSSGSNIITFNNNEVYSTKPLSVNKNAIGNILGNADLVIQSGGSNYNEGSFTNISLSGGTGTGALANFTVSGIGGSITNEGSGYTPGTYSNVSLTGGSGSGITADIVIDGLSGSINGGSGYVDGDYANVPLLGGSGTGAQALINISGGAVSAVTITSEGDFGYQNGDVLTASNTNLGGQGSGFSFTVTNYPYKIISSNFTQTSSGTGYSINDVLSVNAADVGGTGSGFAYTLSGGGIVTSLSLAEGGSGYTVGDILTFDANDLDTSIQYQAEVRSTEFLTFNTPYPTSGFTLGSTATIGAENRTISRVYTSGSDIIAIAVDVSVDGNFTSPVGQTITSGGASAVVATSDVANLYYIDSGSGFVAAPDLVLQTGKRYEIISNDFVNHPIALSTTADGIHAGGTKYEGSEVAYSQTTISIKLTTSSPEPLYLYCENHPNMNGFDGYEGQITKGSPYVAAGSGAEFRVASILDQTYFYVDLDGNVEANDITVNDIVGNSLTISGSLEIAGETIFSGDVVVAEDLISDKNAYIKDTLTVGKNLLVSTSLTQGTGEILCNSTDNIVLGFFSSFLTELEEGTVIYNKDGKFIGVVDTIDSNTRVLLKENSRISITTSESFNYTNSVGLFYDNTTNLLGVNNLIPEYNIDIVGNLKVDEDVILSEGTGFKTVIGDRLNLASMEADDKLYIQGNTIAGGFVYLPNSTSLSTPSLAFSDSKDIGLYYNNTDKYISLTGYTGELSSFKYDSLHFYRDSNFTARNVDEYIINPGSGYTDGNYTDVELIGGTGSGLIADITVAFTTKASQPGEGYTSGEYTGVALSGGNGTGATADITISSGNIANNIQITDPGSGYESAPEITFTDASGDGAVAVANLSSSGSLKNINVNTAGSGYTSAPTVIIGTEWSASNTVEVGQQYFYGANLYTVVVGGTFDGSTPPSHTSGTAFNGTVELEYAGAVAEATAVLGTLAGVNDDQIDFITLSNTGSGYTSVPQISFSGGGGSGASAVAILGFTVESVDVLNGGENYASPTVVFTGGNSSSTAVATASVTNQGVSKVVVTNAGSGYLVGDILSFSENDLIDPNLGTPSVAPTTAASLEITSLGSVTVVNITDFGFGYEANDSITFDLLTAPGNTGGSNFSIDIASTIEENIVTVDLGNSLLTSVGIKSLDGGINVNDNISISDTGIDKTTSGNLLLSATDFVQVSGSGAFIVPAGTTAQRPGNALAGAVRYNSTESRFEGFNGSFFVSLGGVRDVDGNTYISAELNPGDDDNTLRFVNDGTQSMQVEKNKIILQTISSIDRTEIDGITEWEASASATAPADPINDPPVLIYYEDRVYSVDTSGTFDATTGPTHSTGTVTNGTVDLTYVRSIYGSITYTGVDLNLSLDKINLNTNALRVSGDTTLSTLVSTESPELIVGFGNTDDPLLKFTTGGGISVNNGYGGTENYIQVLDYNLRQLDLKDTRILSAIGSIDTSVGNAVNIVLAEYDVVSSTLPLHSGKLMVEIIDDSAVPQRQYTEISYLVKSDLSDILYTENSKIYTDVELCDVSVGIDGSNNITVDVVDLTGSSTAIYDIKVVSQGILI